MKSRLPLLALFVFACLFANLLLAREAAIPKTVDKFTDYMADRFADAMPANKVTIKAPLRLDVALPGGPYSVYLDNIWSACERDRRHCRAVVDDFLGAMPSAMKEGAEPLKAADVRMIVRGFAYVTEMRRVADGKPERAGVARLVAGDLWMVCVADSPHGIRVLQHADLTKLHLSEDQAIALGLKNVAASLRLLEADTHVLKPYGLTFATGDFYESSRMLLHDSWAAMSKSMGGHLVVAVPSSDFLIYGNGGGNGDRIVLGTFAQTVAEKASKPISVSLFHWTPTGWEVAKPE